jgi:hypothetical protein
MTSISLSLAVFSVPFNAATSLQPTMASINEILNYMEHAAPIERVSVSKRAIDALIGSGHRDLEFYLYQLFNEGNVGDSGEFLGQVDATLMGALHAVLRKFGIHCDDDTPLVMLTDIFNGVLCLDNWDDKASIAALCDMEETSDVILAACLELVGHRHEAEYLQVFTYVSDALIERIAHVNAVPGQENLPTTQVRAHALSRVRRFLAVAVSPIFSQAIGEMLLIGGDYKALMSLYGEGVERLDMDDAIPALVGFACASALPDDQIVSTLMDQIHGWWTDSPNAPAQANARIDTLLRSVLTTEPVKVPTP